MHPCKFDENQPVKFYLKLFIGSGDTVLKNIFLNNARPVLILNIRWLQVKVTKM